MSEATGYRAHVNFDAETIQREAHLHGMRDKFGVIGRYATGSISPTARCRCRLVYNLRGALQSERPSSG